MIELVIAIVTILGTTAGVWLRLRAELESSRAAAEVELRKMQSEFTHQSSARDDHWRDVLVASNAQWQTYAQRQLEALQAERDKHIQQLVGQVQELVTKLEQARSELHTATRDAKVAATKAEQVISQNVAEIVALREQVKELQQAITILQEQNKVLTEQNLLLIERKDVSPAEQETLSAEVEASKSDTIEEQQDVA